MVMTSRFALEGLLQNRLGAGDACKNSALRMRESASDLFHLYAGKHHQTDDTSSSSCYGGGGGGGADVTMTAGATTIKRESHTPTTSDQSDDSGVDVCGAAAEGGNAEDGRGRSYNGKRKRSDDDDDDSDGGGDCPSAAKSSRTTVAGPTTATATVLSVNVQAAACPPFRPWSSSDESSSDAGLCRMMFHDIRNVDRIMTLEQQRRLEQQPLDLTKGRRDRRDVVPARTEGRETAERVTAERVAAAHVTVVEQPPVTDSTDASPPPPPPPPCSVATTAAGARYSKNMSRARRIEANARERSRVHTISAAFDTLRSSIPSYSRNQKLSKLSTIRIASAYILTLSRLLDMDYSAEQDSPSVDECVDNVTGIIHMEGKARKKRDEQQQQY